MLQYIENEYFSAKASSFAAYIEYFSVSMWFRLNCDNIEYNKSVD